MNDHAEIGHLTKYDAFTVNRDQVMDLEIRFKIHTKLTSLTLRQRPPKPYKLLKFFISFCDNCKILSRTYYLKEAELKIAMFAHFKEYHGIHKKF